MPTISWARVLSDPKAELYAPDGPGLGVMLDRRASAGATNSTGPEPYDQCSYQTRETVTSSQRLKGKVAVVTGATSGFGEAIARLFATEGAALVLGGRRSGAGEALSAELRSLGADARFVAGDVGNDHDADALAACARSAHGRIDVRSEEHTSELQSRGH